MIELWNKSTITNLSMENIEQWFDVLNQGLEEDRGYQLDDPNIELIRETLKAEYIAYLKSLPKNKAFVYYFVFRNDDQKIVTVCRLMKYKSKYVLEGLETHRDYYHMGYATDIMKQMLPILKRDRVERIHSYVSCDNTASIHLHESFGFEEMSVNENRIQYILEVEPTLRRILFDRWSENYNKDVAKSEANHTYPFSGYSELKYQLLLVIAKRPNRKVLDMGVGTGEISIPLYQLGFSITGVDLSKEMIDIAKSKMPKATFIHASFEQCLLLIKKKYDFIVFNYSIHHLSLVEQVKLLIQMRDFLKKDGKILIGDVATRTSKKMEALQIKYESVWDEEENYPVFDRYLESELQSYYDMEYQDIDEVTGLFLLQNKNIGG